MTTRPVESARFRPDDPDALVEASFACPWCLCRPGRATVLDPSGAAAVECRCDRCRSEWTVALSAEQSLRVALRPPWRGSDTIVRLS